MPRVQVGYNPGAEALQTTAAPNIQTQMVANDPNSLKAVQLAEAVASPSAMQQFDVLSKKMIEEERQQELSAARNMSNDELEKQIKEGKMLPFQSPVRVAAMHHVYGENLYNRLEMDVSTKVARGEFPKWSDVEDYLHSQRKTLLGEQDKFTTAGFDKYWPQLINKAQTLQLHSQNAQATEFANTQANTKMNDVLLQIEQGKVANPAQALGDAYRDIISKKLLTTPQQRESALNGVATALTKRGNVADLDGFFDQKLDNGARVRDVLGPGVVEQYKLNAENVQKRQVADAAKAQAVARAEESQTRLRSAVELSAGTGNFALAKGILVRDAKVFNASSGAEEKVTESQLEDMAVQATQKQVVQNNLNMEQQVRLWGQNNLDNPEWKSKIQGINLASIGQEYEGKKVGELSEQSKVAVATYLEVAKYNPEMADKLAGDPETARTLRRIKFQMEGMSGGDINQAANTIYAANNSGIRNDDFTVKTKDIEKVVDNVINPSWYSKSYRWAESFWGGNQDINKTAIMADARQMAKDLVQAGRAEPEAAVEAAMKYLSSPAVTSVINNTVYYNKDLPQVPPGADRAKYFERFIREKAAYDYKGEAPTKGFFETPLNPLSVLEDAARLGASKAPVSEKPEDKIARMAGTLRLSRDPSGTYVLMTANVPARSESGQMITYSKNDIEGWIKQTFDSKQTQENRARNGDMGWESWRDSVVREYYDARKGTTIPGQSGAAPLGFLTSREQYEKFKEKGQLGRPVTELWELTKKTKGK